MRTADEALAGCLALGTSRAVCEEVVASQMVGGVFCDGTIVLDADGRRCVTAERAADVQRVRERDPLELSPAAKRMQVVEVIAFAAVVGLGIWLWRD